MINTNGVGTKRHTNTSALLQTEQVVKAIPYFAWANRDPVAMTVWVPYEASAAKPQPAPTIASTSKVTDSIKNTRTLTTLVNQYDPQDSRDSNYPYLHWWPNKNTKEFLQLNF